MIKKVIGLLKKPKTQDERLISEIKNLPLNQDYIATLEKYLKKDGFENINVCDGEYENISKTIALECCLDIYFEKDYLYMLSVYEDGIILLKNKHRISKIDNHSMEDIEYEEIYKRKLDESIISSLRTIHKIA